MVHPVRIRTLTEAQVRKGRYVLYWMTAFRRPHYNFALDRALEHADREGRPLLVFEALRVGYRWASDRMHAFVLDGMHDNRAAFESAGVAYYPYVEKNAGEGSGLLEALAKDACVVVTDDFPCFFLPRMLEAAADKLQADDVLLEAVDGNGLYPIYDTDRIFTRAHSFRRHLQKRLPAFLAEKPSASPFRKERPKASVAAAIRKRWPPARKALLSPGRDLSSFPIDHDVSVASERGGFDAGRARLDAFLKKRFSRYADDRNHPDDDASSGLSPYLHFGFVSAHEIFARIVRKERWSIAKLPPKASGSREGWWRMSPAAESFLDELITWREVGFNQCAHDPAYDQWSSLPAWARQTLSEHKGDKRPHLYTLMQFEGAQTHDEIWNAAQRQLVQTGRMHNYLRMLWGKKILEWSKTPEDALATMIELNNKYALDGRNPNSYSGIFWVLGRYDRAWGPERPIFGKIRFMSSDSTRRKLHLKNYLATFGASSQTKLAF
ncbi:MAG: deoxyribodipyrimidine photolyase [Myxococcota bacterium]